MTRVAIARTHGARPLGFATAPIVLLLAVLLLPISLRASEAETDAPGDVEHVFYLSDAGLIVLRLHVRVDGRSPRAAWDEYVGELFASLDANQDGALTESETQGIPSESLLRQTGMVSGARNEGDAASADFNPRDGKVTREELSAYFLRVGVQAFSTQGSTQAQGQTGGTQSSADTAARLFLKVDENADGKLSQTEFESSLARLRKLDLDNDETISAAELAPLQNPFVGQSMNNNQPQQTTAFLSLAGEQSETQVARQLLSRYDRSDPGSRTPKDYKLSSAELNVSDAEFQPHDIDGDARLDFDELRQFLQSPPASVELVVRLGARDEGEQPIELLNTSDQFAGQVRTASDGSVNLALDRIQIDIAAGGQGASWQVNLTRLYEANFKQADTDNNAYLEEKEVRQNPYFRQTFALMDTDGDGKVFEPEMLRFAENQSAAAQARAVLSVTDQGRNLFEILDANRDGRLSRREFLSAIPRIKLWDGDGDGDVARAEIPQQYRLALGRATPNMGVNVLPAQGAYSGPQANPQQPMGGPVWFRKMDVNRDGEVSQREFLGKFDQFGEIDTNANGAIDMGEALSVAP